MALRADGNGDYGSRTSGGFLDAPPFTICFWVYREGTVNTSGVFGLRNHLGSDDGYCLFYNYNNDGSSYAWEQGGGAYPNIGPFTLPLNTWHFIGLSYASTASNQATTYRRTPSDSALTAVTGTFPALSNGSGITQEVVLAQNYDLVNTFLGRIAALKQWSAALTAGELLTESYSQAPRRFANLHSWRPMIHGSIADAVLDFSGNGRNLTANGSLLIADGPPAGWMRRKRIFIPSAGGGGGASVALNGVIGGRSLSQASMAVVRSLSGLAQGRGRAMSSPTVARPLGGVVTGRGRATGPASILRPLSGTVGGRSSVQGAAGALRSLSSAIAGRASVVGNLGTAALVALVGAVTGRSSVQGALSIVRNLSGRADGRTRTSGTASMVRNLTARVAGRSTARSAASALRALSSVIRAGATVRASFPPLVTEVVGIVRALLRGSMKTAPITASGKISIPIVVSANNMIAKNVRLKDYVLGDDTEIAFELTDWPAGVALAKAYFTVKGSLSDSDADSIIQREITTVLSAEGQITANGSSGTATGYFLIRHQDPEWAAIRPIGPYHFDIQPITDQSTVQTPIIGTISFQKGATDATS